VQQAITYSDINPTSSKLVLEGRLFGVAVDSARWLINVTALQADPRPENLGAFTQMNVV
jgi:hypothetical protein